MLAKLVFNFSSRVCYNMILTNIVPSPVGNLDGHTLCIPYTTQVLNIFEKQSFSIIRAGRPVRTSARDGYLLGNLGMLELSYRFQTFHGDSCSG